MESQNISSFLNLNLICKIINLYIIISVITSKKEAVRFYTKNINYYNINFFDSSKNIDFNLIFNLSSFHYNFNYTINKCELEYNFQFFDKNNNLIIPSDLALYYNLHVFCILKKMNTNIHSVSNIHQNKFFNCLEYYESTQPIKFGIKICNDILTCRYIDLFHFKGFNYNCEKLVKEYKYNYINKHPSSIFPEVQISNKNSSLLTKSYFSQPIFKIKENAIFSKNDWYFKNIYNHYFCYCNGHFCKFSQSFDDCKYYLYLSIIDNNKNLYEKTHYLLVDFLYSNRAPGDSYFVFREMIKQNMSAYYLSERKDLFYEHYDNKTNFQKIIPIINGQYNITGKIVEKYLSLFLKLKSVISGSEFLSKENIFYNIPYITFICLGHGVNYFKSFLYEDYYGFQRYDKIVLPSEKIISIAKQYGWKEENIIKIGLPKWDLLDIYSSEIKSKLGEKCMFMMFTWRKLKEGKNISSSYFNNIFKLLNDSLLNEILNKKNITLYFSLHHNLLNQQNEIQDRTKAKYINQDDILTCLKKCNLLISDFSSVIFDFMHRKKPFIIFIPDSEDKNISDLYDVDYLNVINRLKNDSIKFENKIFNVDDTIKKIIYYVNNNFRLDYKLKTFYKLFNLNQKNNINRFIEYLKSI